LILLHPVVAERSCEDCRKWWYDDAWKDGRQVWSTRIIGQEKVEQHAKSPAERAELMEKVCRRPLDPKTKEPKTPCEHCPKVSPQEAHRHVLNKRNEQAYRFYLESEAVDFRNLTQETASDEIVMRNFRIIKSVRSRAEQNSGVASLMAMMLGGGKKHA
jgi:chromatin segregation and condensation protein Rec8/ScpA/Scc1 (kleisin family)